MSDLVCRVQDSTTGFPHLKLMPSVYILASVLRVRAQGSSLQTKWELNAQITWVWGARYFHMCSSRECLFCKQFHFVKLLENLLELYKAFIQKKKKNKRSGFTCEDYSVITRVWAYTLKSVYQN